MEAKSFEDIPTFKKLEVQQSIKDFIIKEHDEFFSKIKEENPLNLKSTETEEQSYWVAGDIIINPHTKEVELWLKAGKRIITHNE